MKQYLFLLLAVSCLCFTCNSTAQPANNTAESASKEKGSERVNIIPMPHSVKSIKGESFVINEDTKIYYPAGKREFKKSAEQLARPLRKKTGFSFVIEPMVDGDHSNAIILTGALDRQEIAEEGYELSVNANRVLIRAAEPAGAFYGIQTLRQLLPTGIDKGTDAKKWRIPAVEIKDQPRFSWRGMHIDVSRHFFSVETIKEFIDYMAYYKFNRLHMHLTDDQGWRLQIKQYPKLTEEGAWRTFNSQDSVAIERAKTNPVFKLPEKFIKQRNGKKVYGGFYTQVEMKQIIEYAQARHITIVPEIDMPGHLMSAIQSYPFLSCTGEAEWGQTFSVPACPCKESTFTFLKNVLDEVAALFPGKYIHIGADEVEKTTWKQSNTCRQLMREEGLESVEEIQSYFVKRMANYLQSKGKKVIGWDEIIQGGIPDGMIMMFWRNWVPEAPMIAADHGNKIIMTPGSPLYFNTEQTPESLRKVYGYEPVPDSFTEQQASLISGAQGNLWSEWIPTKERLYHMAMPRMLALSEVVWSQKEDRSWAGFTKRIQPHYTRLDMQGINYRQPDLKGFHPKNVFIDTVVVRFIKPREAITLYYTTDGSEPTPRSTRYTGPFTLTETTTVRLKTYLPTGDVGKSYKTQYVQQGPKPDVPLQSPTQGLHIEYTSKAYHTVDDFDFDEDKSARGMTVSSFEVPDKIGQMPTFGLIFSGYIKVPADGVYTFYTSTDDGSKLYVAGQLVVDNDKPHSEIEKTTAQVALQAGYHPIRLKFFELGGGFALHVFYVGPGISKQPVPPNQLFYQKP